MRFFFSAVRLLCFCSNISAVSQNVNLFDIQWSKCYRKTCSCKINLPPPFIFHKPPVDIRLLEQHILEQTESRELSRDTQTFISEHYFLFSTEQKSLPQAGCRSTYDTIATVHCV